MWCIFQRSIDPNYHYWVMAGRELDPREIAAAELVTSMIGGRAVPKDIGDAPEKMVDFPIEDLPNPRTAALEVTGIADPRVVSKVQAAFGRTWSRAIDASTPERPQSSLALRRRSMRPRQLAPTSARACSGGAYR